jgi:hypothetical protein
MADFWLIEVECKWLKELSELLDGSFFPDALTVTYVWICVSLTLLLSPCPRLLCFNPPPSCDVSCVCAEPFRASCLSVPDPLEIGSFSFLFSFGFFIYLFFFIGKRQEKVVSMVVRYWLLVTTSASRGKPIKSKDPPLNILIFLLTYFFFQL